MFMFLIGCGDHSGDDGKKKFAPSGRKTGGSAKKVSLSTRVKGGLNGFGGGGYRKNKDGGRVIGQETWGKMDRVGKAKEVRGGQRRTMTGTLRTARRISNSCSPRANRLYGGSGRNETGQGEGIRTMRSHGPQMGLLGSIILQVCISWERTRRRVTDTQRRRLVYLSGRGNKETRK